MTKNAANKTVRAVFHDDIAYTSPTHWYVVHTKPYQEFRALEQLQNQDYECYLPTLQVTKLYRGKSGLIIEPLFSRYLFIHLDNANTDWGPIRSTRGVSNMVSFGGRFAILPANYVAALKNMPQHGAENELAPRAHEQINSEISSELRELHHLPNGGARAFVLIELMRQTH